MSFKQLVHIASCLVPHYYVIDSDQFKVEWESLLKKAFQAEQIRNLLLHSTFGVSWDEDPIFVRNKVTANKIGKGLKEVGEALTPDVMNNYRHQIGNLTTQISGCFSRTFPKWRLREWRPKWDKE